MEREYFAGEFDLERPKGRIYDKKPFKIGLEAGKLYAWCTCGISRNQVRSVFNCSFMSISFRLSRVPLTTRLVSTRPFLPSATVVAERLCFHRCLSVHRGEVYTPPGQADTPRHLPPRQTASAADCTHPTGMHSCLQIKFGIEISAYIFGYNEYFVQRAVSFCCKWDLLY